MELSSPSSGSRRGFLTDALWQVAGVAGLSLVGSASPLTSPAGATVFLETERYGDKELKIATLNKLKQQLRNKMLENPNLAPMFIKLAISDALGYNAKSDEGGLDGSVVLEMDREQNAGLKPALDAAFQIKNSLQRTNEVTVSDILAFAGGEAIEASGGPRVVVQIGRYDEKKRPNPPVDVPGFSLEAPTAAGLKTAFQRSGMGAREVALLFGAMGSITDNARAAIEFAMDETPDDLVDSGWENAVPSTFGGQSEMYGKRIGDGAFGTAYMERLLKAEKKPSSAQLSALDQALLEDLEVKSYLTKYASNKKAFFADVAEAYQKMTLLGERYETRLLAD